MEKKMDKITRTGYIGLGLRRNGNENGNYYNGLYRDYYEDPLQHS